MIAEVQQLGGSAADRETIDQLVDRLLQECHPRSTDAATFLSRQFDDGLAWVHFPEGRGGLGLAAAVQPYVDRRLAAEGGPIRQREDMLGYRMGAPTLLRHGTPEQLLRYLRPAFTMAERWCQLFSEPGAGSDLASLSTSARRLADGGWVVNGQKVWTSYASDAQLGMLLARTDPDLPKHQGITFFVLDMSLPGVEVRPLRQITGDAEFSETFLTDVPVSDDCRIGNVGQGWRIAQTTLANERSMYGSRGFDNGAPGTAIAAALEAYRANPTQEPELRARLVRLWINSQLLGWTNRRVSTSGAPNSVAPPVAKVSFARIQQDGFDLALDLMGEAALVGAGGGADPSGRLFPDPDARHGYLRSRANSIEGGSSEIMRNIIAQRVLGLPTTPKDRDVPWSRLRRS